MDKNKKEKTEKELQFNKNFADKFKKLKKDLSTRYGRKIIISEIAEKLKVSGRSVDYYLSGDTPFSLYDIYRLIKYYHLSCSDIAFLFDFKINETLKTLPLSNSDNPEINKKINILKQIYESGDETLICGVDLCLKGAYEDFLGRKKKKIG